MTAGFGRVLAMGVALVAIQLALHAGPSGQTTVATGTGVVSGRVVDATTRQPVRAASVQISSVPADPFTYPIQDCCGMITVNMGGRDFGRSTTTDADGRFTFANLPARTLELQAVGRWPAGWAMWGETSPTDGGRWLELGDGQRVDGLEIALPRMAVVSGRVLDERGEPVGGISVNVTPAALAGAALRYGGQGQWTDDRGTYLTTVYPGEYFVSTAAYPAVTSTLGSRPASAFARVFFPQSDSVESAARLILGPGDERTNVDFVIAPRRVFRISGVAEDPVANLNVELFTANGRVPGAAPLAQATVVQGRFGFGSVPPGRYALHALARPQMPYVTHGIAALIELPSAPTVWADSMVTVVDRDVEVRLGLQSGVRISGRVEFDGSLPRPPLADLVNRPLIVERADGSESDFRGAYLPGERFSTIQIEPGRYIVRPSPPGKWRLKSVMVGGRDISDYAVELAQADVNDAVITFTDRRSAIAGRLVRQGPQDLTRGWITVFPTDRAYWADYGVYPRRIAFIECGRSGVFEAEVPPGSYHVAATRGATRGRLSVAQLSALAASATTVVVGDNQIVHVDVGFPRVQR